MSESITPSFLCRAGLCPVGCWIESPKTGRRIEFARTLEALRRIIGRITQKVASGVLRCEFTTDELHAVKSVADAAAEHEAKKTDDPAMHFGMTKTRISEYGYWTFANPGRRTGGYNLRADDTFETDTKIMPWPPFGNGLWFRHPCGPAMVIAGPSLETLSPGLVGKFNGKQATFTGDELNALNAAATATNNDTPRRSYRRRRFF